tara:strand:- start:22 stop:732 length:711 start_codon:yes stop_codon:yes gene_type:complete
MSKNEYRFIILNDKTRFNISLIFSNKIFYLILFLILFLLSLSTFGIYRIFTPHPKQSEFNTIYDNQRNLTEILKKLVEDNSLDSNLMKNFNLKKIYLKDISLVPNIMPVEGIVTNGINLKSNPPHNGLDIAAKFNSNVYAAQKGLVIFASSLDELGSTIIIAHPNNYYSLYSHLNKIFVSKRDYVKGNQSIGTIGESGNSDGPHLHFEIWENSNIIDPRELIKEYKLKDVSIKKNL